MNFELPNFLLYIKVKMLVKIFFLNIYVVKNAFRFINLFHFLITFKIYVAVRIWYGSMKLFFLKAYSFSGIQYNDPLIYLTTYNFENYF